MINSNTNEAVDGAVYQAVKGTVNRAMSRATYGAVYWAAVKDPPHPGLQDFQQEAEAE